MLDLQLHQIPDISTERLLLRQQVLSDAPALYDLRNDDRVMQFIDRPRHQNIQESEQAIQAITENMKNGLSMIWAIALKDRPDQMIGNLGYWHTDLANFRAELGYMLHPDYWRQGLLSEALKPVIEYGYSLGFHSICANINPGNTASRQLLLKHGFVKEAYFKENYYFNGRFLDSEIYGRLNHDSMDLAPRSFM